MRGLHLPLWLSPKNGFCLFEKRFIWTYAIYCNYLEFTKLLDVYLTKLH